MADSVIVDKATEGCTESSVDGTGWSRAETLACRLEAQPWLILACLTIFYIFAISVPARLILWHDELFTFYIAKSTSWQQFITSIRLLDLNPPLDYFLTGIAQHLFGDGPVATRLPAILGFYATSLICFYFISKRTGSLWGAFTVLLLWYGPLLYFATQARPYAILMAFFSLTLLSWDRAIQSTSNRSLALAGIVIGNTGMMLSHVFAIFSIGPFLLAELIRWHRTRRADWSLWACLIAPMGLAASYFPLLNRFQAEAFPVQYQAGPRKVVSYFYKWIYANICQGLLGALLAAFICSRSVRNASTRQIAITAGHIALFVGFLLPPLLINLVLMRTHGAFWDRYCMTTGVTIYVALGLFLSYKFGASRLTAFAATVVLAGMLVGINIIQPYVDQQARRRVLPKIDFTAFRPELPFVAASGLTFVEMDHNESVTFDRRLYYLTNRAAAMKYAHATIFEGLALEAKHFPIRGRVSPYDEFTKTNPHFLVIGTLQYPEDWLLKKLQDDGAQLTYLGDYFTPYKDSSIYEVRLHP